MAKGKLKTPDWVLKGEKKPKKDGEKKFVLKCCPACGSRNVSVVLGEKYMWQCNDCGFKGTEIIEQEVSENDFLKRLDEEEK